MNITTRLGAATWLLATPLFLVLNLMVGSAWTNPPYSWATNNISDLGNVGCGVWDTSRPRPVCSPWHPVMNGGFIATGLLLAVGVVLTASALGRGAAAAAAKILVFAGGVGFIMAGAFPADTHENLHFFAALLIFGLANIGLLLAALGRGALLVRVRPFSVTMALAGFVGSALFFAQVDVGIGLGGMERVAVFPLLAWTFMAAVVLRSRSGARSGPGSPETRGGRHMRPNPQP